MRVVLNDTTAFKFAASVMKPEDLASLEVKDGKAQLVFYAQREGVGGRLALKATEVEGDEAVGLTVKVVSAIGRLSGNVEIKTTEKQIRVKNYGNTYRFAKAEVPELSSFEDERAETVFKFQEPAKSIKAALKIVKTFANGGAYPVMDSVNVIRSGEFLEFIGSDGSFLAYFGIRMPEKVEEDKKFLISKRYIQVLTKAMEYVGTGEVKINPAVVFVTDGESVIVIPQTAGEYPDAKSLVLSAFYGEGVEDRFCKIKVLKEQIENVGKALKSVVEDDTHLPFQIALPENDGEYLIVKRCFVLDEEDTGYVEAEMFYEDICEDKDKLNFDDMFPYEPLLRFVPPFKQDAQLVLYFPKEGENRIGLAFEGESIKALTAAIAIKKE